MPNSPYNLEDYTREVDDVAELGDSVFGGMRYLNIPGTAASSPVPNWPSGPYLGMFRLYDPSNGVWMSQDPLGYLDSPNMSAYVAQNPVGMIDPLGLSRSPDSQGNAGRSSGDLLQTGLGKSTGMVDRIETDQGTIFSSSSIVATPASFSSRPSSIQHSRQINEERRIPSLLAQGIRIPSGLTDILPSMYVDESNLTFWVGFNNQIHYESLPPILAGMGKSSLSANGIKLLRTSEGNGENGHPFESYDDSSGFGTIGWGHLLWHTSWLDQAPSPYGPNLRWWISPEDAEALFNRDIAEMEKRMISTLGMQKFSALTPGQRAGLLDYVYQTGTLLEQDSSGRYSRGPLVKAIDSNDWLQVATVLRSKTQYLSRRKAEINVILGQ